MDNGLKFAILIATLAGSSAANALTVNYRFELKVASISSDRAPIVCPAPSPWPEADYRSSSAACRYDHGEIVPVVVGDTFTGRFQIEQDVSVLADGFYDIPFKSFSVTVGQVDFDLGTDIDDLRCSPSFPDNPSCLAMFRSLVADSTGSGSPYSRDTVGFHVVGGEIFSFVGWTVDQSDIYDLYLYDYNCYDQFTYPITLPEKCPVGDERIWRFSFLDYVEGSYSIWRVPEPGTLALLGLGLAGLGLSRRRKAT